MTSTIKNIIIFVVIGLILILAYVYFIKKPPEVATLVPSSSSILPSTNSNVLKANTNDPNSLGVKDFLPILLSVKSIKLDDSILSDVAFNTLRDSSFPLIPDGNEGRPNPFAPLGSDVVTVPANTSNTNTQTLQPAN